MQQQVVLYTSAKILSILVIDMLFPPGCVFLLKIVNSNASKEEAVDLAKARWKATFLETSDTVCLWLGYLPTYDSIKVKYRINSLLLVCLHTE